MTSQKQFDNVAIDKKSELSLIFFDRRFGASPPPPLFRFPPQPYLNGSSSPSKKSRGDDLRVKCLMSVRFRLAIGRSSSRSSYKYSLRLVSAGKGATTRRRLYFPASDRRQWASACRRVLVSSTRPRWLVGEYRLRSLINIERHQVTLNDE